jgi:hypothetical protein
MGSFIKIFLHRTLTSMPWERPNGRHPSFLLQEKEECRATGSQIEPRKIFNRCMEIDGFVI